MEDLIETYKERAARLIAEGKMHESGLKSIAVSKANGLWPFMDDVDDLINPKDLSEALSNNAGASEFFDSIKDSSKRFALRWIKLAKTEKTRKKKDSTISSIIR